MKHFLSKKTDLDKETVNLDVSFITKYLSKLVDMPTEVMIAKYYHLRSKGDDNTVQLFKEYLKKTLKLDNDIQLYKLVGRKKFTKIVLKIKATIDSLIYKEYGCEILDAKFISFISTTRDSVIIKVEISR